MIKKFLSLVLIISLCLTVGTVKHPTTVFAVETTYYIDTAGNNSNNGTSPSTPWQDFTNVNSHGAFGAGDKILLKRGCTWNQQMTITGTGIASNMIEIGAYGSGSRPIITRNSLESDRVIKLTNPSYWSIHDLEIKNAGSGIYVYFNTTGHDGLYFDNIYVHDITGIHQGNGSGYVDAIWNSGGIQITGSVNLTSPTQYVLKTVRLNNIEGTHNQSSISLDFYNGGQRSTFSGGASNDRNVMQDVVMNHAYLHDDNNSTLGCDEGMRFCNINGGTVLNSIFDNEASAHSDTGTAALFVATLNNAAFVNNLIVNTPDTCSPDMAGVDFEACTDTVRFLNNYIANNAGTGLSYLAIWSDWSNNNEASGNMFVNNGNGSFRRYGNSDPVPPNGTIHDNLYNEPNSFLYEDGADFSGFTFANNISIGSSSSMYHGANQFSGTQGGSCWSYQLYNGSSYSNLSYDLANQWWGNSTCYVSRFEELPNSTSSNWVARAWTAPSAGTISIRGRVLKSDTGGGDGIKSKITKNGTIIWPTNGTPQTITSIDQSGVDTNLDSVTVTTGDVIRFEVNNGGSENSSNDTTSWAPSVAYTTPGESARAWEFSLDTEGWTAWQHISGFGSQAGGYVCGTITGADPYAYSGDNLGVDITENKIVKVRMKNDTVATSAGIFFTTNADGTFDTSKRKSFPINANDTNYTEYTIDMSTVPGWTGTLKRLRLDPIDDGVTSSGMFSVDYIRIQEATETVRTWEFTSNTEGWTAWQHISGFGWQTGGNAGGTITGPDPYVYSGDNLGVNITNSKILKVRMKNSTAANSACIFFTTNADGTFNDNKCKIVPIIANDTNYTEYTIDMSTVSGWTGTLKQLRLDPINDWVTSSGIFSVDYIRIQN